MLHKRDMANLEDKISRLDGSLQNAMKEKNQLASLAVAREKEVAELRHRQVALRSNVSI